MDSDNVATIYTLPYSTLGALMNDEAAPTAAGPDATPAEASGLDLPVGGFGGIGASGGGGGGGGGVIGLPPGSGGSGGGGSGSSGGGGGGGGGSGGGSSGGGGPTTGPGGPGGGGVHPGVPEPATWALMLIGVGAIGGVLRRGRRLTLSA